MINFAFDKSLTVNSNGDMEIPFPNMHTVELYGYDINVNTESYIELQTICKHLNWDLHELKKDTVDNFIKRGETFIYSILIWNNDLFTKTDRLELPTKIKEQIKLKKCKFVIFYVTEPWFKYEYCYTWMSKFAEHNELEKDDFLLVSSNLISNEMKNEYVSKDIIKDNFTIIEFNFFFHRLWFYTKKFHLDDSKEVYNLMMNRNLNLRREREKDKHFLCFNRRSHDHRVFIFSEFMTNPKLIDKSIITLGSQGMIGDQNFKKAIRRFVDKKYKHGYERLYDFIDNYDASVDYRYDTETTNYRDLIDINVDAHVRTFCNVVTETTISEETIFISEKTAKPIFMLQPFIIFGNRGTLRKLREMGFKTFDKWWDESYDEAWYQDRSEKIISLLEEIASWDDNKIKNVLNEMEETLIYNYNVMVKNQTTIDFFNEFIKFTS